MSDDRDEIPPPVDDPFLADDPEAFERERRRQAREAKRRERSSRRSLASRVGGAIDGAADRGREAIEKGKERAGQSEPPPTSAEPPAFRRPPVAPATSESRMSAETLMPRRPARSQPPIEAPIQTSPEPVADAPPDAGPVTDDHDWFTDTDGGPPPEVPAERRAFATGEYPPLPPPSSPPPGAGRKAWVQRGVALLVILLLGGAIYAVASGLGGDDPAPVSDGPKSLKTLDVTIPEGYTRTQMAEVAKDAGLKGDYEKGTAQAPKGFDIEKTGAPKGASLEGFLFPATYNLEKGASVDALIKDQLTAYNTNIGEVDLKAAEKKNLTEYDVVIIASMIEREVLVPEERPVVAAVIYNRLSQGMSLGIDATLRYDLDNFDEPLTESELQSDSPYNTRLNQGLPPTPIANPGLDSLKAAADPADVNYTYYVVKPDTCGEHYFTDDYDDFLAASDKYESARVAQGGAPTDC